MNKSDSLEDKALTQVAINLCQENDFKEVAMCLEKPTYGCFINGFEPLGFVSDPEKLSTWAKVKEDDRLRDVFMKALYPNGTEKAWQWDAAIDEQCQRLTEGMPPGGSLRQKVHAWVNRIALEYLSFSRRQEMLFGVSRYLLMNIFTRGDWKISGRLDEEKLAQRLLEDEHLTVLQKYRIACVYCLHVHIPPLWKKLTQEEKRSTGGNAKSGLSKETHGLVLLWSHHMIGDWKEKVIKHQYLWARAAQKATSYGNRSALMLCWKKLKEPQQIAINMALQSLKQWQCIGKSSYTRGIYKERLVSNNFPPKKQSACSIKYLNLPSYYSELVHFFLSQLDQEQQLTFFRKAFQSRDSDSVLECFLDWPHQDDFLPTIKWLWKMKIIIPKDKYVQCLLALARKYSRNDEKENSYYDYRSLLKTLWKETPEEYKKYVFRNIKGNYLGKDLFCLLSERSPFQKEDEALIEQIFCDQPQEERRAMMRSETGQNICLNLMQKEKWSFVDRLLEECLSSKEEISSFKKEFLRSKCGQQLCMDALENNCERLVEGLIDWSLDLDAERKQCKDELKDTLISRNACFDVCESLLRVGKFADVERVINFCFSSDEKKEQFKVRCAQYVCGVLLEGYTHDCWLEDYVWEQMDTIIAWSVDTEEKIRDFKKNLFSRKRIDIHYYLVFVKEVWGKVERFYQWFGLFPEEIKKLKKDTLFEDNTSYCVIQDIHEDLPEYTTELVASLRWCLTDEEMVIDLKKRVEEEYFKGVLDERKQKEKERLDDLMSELLDGFRKEVQDKTSREGVFVKETGEKRSVVEIEDNSSSSRKRCKLSSRVQKS